MSETRGPDAVFASLELTVRRRLAGRLQGDQAGLGLGPGSEPEEVVAYRPGEDDVRRIDWNVTARAGEPHVWRPRAEHELETWVLLDDTASMDFGTIAHTKRELAAAATAAMGLLVDKPGNRLGTAHLTEAGLRWSQPLPGRAAARRVLRKPEVERPEVELVETRRRISTSSISDGDFAAALKTFAARHPRTGLRVVVSDFVEPDGRMERPFGWERSLRRLAVAHETLVVEVIDPRELELPDVGSVTLLDPESGRRREIWTGSRKLRESYAAAAAAHRAAVAEAVRGARAGHLVLRTDRDWVRDLARHVLGRRTQRPDRGRRLA